MSEHADDALDAMMDDDEMYCRLVDVGWEYLNDYEREFMYPDYGGVMRRSPFAREPKPCGPGKCPTCGGDTAIKSGVHGKFYGCKAFPKCKGSRNI